MREFERLMEAEANHAHNAAELEALVLLLPSEKSRQLALVQVASKGEPQTSQGFIVYRI
jgi:hypothetical protein